MNRKNVPPNFLALGPLDGRYHEIGEQLADYFSEFALMRTRVEVEIEWLIYLMGILKEGDLPANAKRLSPAERQQLRMLYSNDFDNQAINRIKAIEYRINHDVKAVELFIDEKLDQYSLSALKPLVHIGCTSEDINNLSYALMMRRAMQIVWSSEAVSLIDKLNRFALEWADIPMLAHTHGQPATPTTLGKEFRVMTQRLNQELLRIQLLPILGKFNGATGTYAAIAIAYSGYDWIKLNRLFIEDFFNGLEPNLCTTQIEPHDWLINLLDGIRHFNNIIRDIDQNLWIYISKEYLVQIPRENEVGSSTMPHKVNPIRFENSEANCEMGNGICQVLTDQLATSRMQRDLSDSSLLRNVGLALGYSLQAIKYCHAGLNRIAPGKYALQKDLESHYEVLAEAIQTVLRKHGIPDAYEQLKTATRGHTITAGDIQNFISHLISGELANNPSACDDLRRLAKLTPETYIGYAIDIAEGKFS